MDMPAVTDAAVIRWPHEGMNEVGVAFLVTEHAPDWESIRDHCRASLASYKCPAKMLSVSELPRNAMGKVLKRELADQLRKQTGQA